MPAPLSVAQCITVGFFGLFFLARAEGELTRARLSDLPAVRAISDQCGEVGYSDGWRLGRIPYGEDYYDPAMLCSALVGHTGAPALAMYVYDSRFATVAIDSPLGIDHWFYLDPQAAMATLDEPDEEPLEPPDDDETVDLLLRWTAEAGLPADEDELPAAFHRGPGVGGEGIIHLVRVLGVRIPGPRRPVD
jgi:hypothetical protein